MTSTLQTKTLRAMKICQFRQYCQKFVPWCVYEVKWCLDDSAWPNRWQWNIEPLFRFGLVILLFAYLYFNTLRPRDNFCHFPDDVFKSICFNENVYISIKISLKFVPKGPIDNIPALVQILAWRRSGDKPSSEAIMLSLLTYTCVTPPRWVEGIKKHYENKKLSENKKTAAHLTYRKSH